MNNSDRNNPRRLIRAIEIALQVQNLNPKIKKQSLKLNMYNILTIGLTAPKEILFEKIDRRVERRIREGALDEIRRLNKKGYSWDLPSFSSTGIRQMKEFFTGKQTLKEAIEKWKAAEHQYAKRQMTWFKKQKNIHWFDVTENDYLEEIEKKVEKWYT